MDLKIKFNFSFVLLLLILGCSTKIKPADIKGNWVSIYNNSPNTEIYMTVTDTTITTDFSYDKEKKKILFFYKIISKKDNLLLLEVSNPAGLKEVDTLRIENSVLFFSTKEGKTIQFVKF